MLQDARARYAVLKDSAETVRVSRRRYDRPGAELDGNVTRSALSKRDGGAGAPQGRGLVDRFLKTEQ